MFDAATAELYAAGCDAVGLGDRTRETYISGKDSDEAPQGRAFRSLRVGGETVGAIGFQGLNDAAIAGPLAALAAAALERAKAVRRASDSAAEAQAERLRTAILDALAHEFKTPLATILTAAGGLREAGPLGRDQAELAELVETEAERLSDLSSRLLRLARLDSEDVKPRPEAADLVSIVGGIIERYSRQYPERQFLFEKQGRSNQISADVSLLHLAIGQVVDNACRYSPAGSPVKVTVQFEDGSANAIVWNSGVRISPEEGVRIFERFYRGTDAQRISSGSGLGLYVARKIAVAHGGALALDYNHAVDGGVAFRLTLPILKERT
jgi:two-component system sensor histidine kinase KdpD